MLYRGDCLEKLKELPENSIEALITDPPAGISFMNKEWDSDKGGKHQWIFWLTEVMLQVIRVMKPGAHGFVWALPRTSHWTAMSLENAGFEVRDVVTHLFGTGFPKSHNLGDGLGTALKPASEHWLLIRKPLSEKTIAKNVEKWGVGGLNIDATRIEGKPESPGTTPPTANGNDKTHGKMIRSEYIMPSGRWPANLTLDEEAAEMLDEQSGFSKGGTRKQVFLKRRGNGVGTNIIEGNSLVPQDYNDSGGASRFFYVAKASKKERGEDNHHPTIKSLSLMQYLIKMITPKDGTILDPFMGSGSTGVAAKRLGFPFIGIEKNEEYFTIAEKRING